MQTHNVIIYMYIHVYNNTHNKCILVLLDFGASRAVRTACGVKPLTPYDMAEKWGHLSVMRLLTKWEPPEVILLNNTCTHTLSQLCIGL
jgi:hypothetical protein